MITLFDSRLSLNCYKIRLLLSILNVSYVRQAVDLRKGEHKSPEMLAMNPFGQVPVLRTDSLALRDSTAILVWIARTYGSDEWIPRDADAEAEVNAWLMASAFELRLGPYEARLKKHFPSLCVTGDMVNVNTVQALQLYEARLAGHAWVALDHATIADIAAFPALAHCGDGDVDLAPYPAIRAWLDRVRGLDGFVNLLD